MIGPLRSQRWDKGSMLGGGPAGNKRTHTHTHTQTHTQTHTNTHTITSSRVKTCTHANFFFQTFKRHICCPRMHSNDVLFLILSQVFFLPPSHTHTHTHTQSKSISKKSSQCQQYAKSTNSPSLQNPHFQANQHKHGERQTKTTGSKQSN